MQFLKIALALALVVAVQADTLRDAVSEELSRRRVPTTPPTPFVPMRPKQARKDICPAVRAKKAQRQQEKKSGVYGPSSIYAANLRACVQEFKKVGRTDCAAFNRTTCAESEKCQWSAREQTCSAAVCKGLNNGMCGLPHSPGCVFIQKGQQIGTWPNTGKPKYAKNSKCMSNPCANPPFNNITGCEEGERSGSIFQCAWCSGKVTGCYSQTVTPCGAYACPGGKCQQCKAKNNAYCSCFKKLGYPANIKQECPGVNLKGLKKAPALLESSAFVDMDLFSDDSDELLDF